MQTYHLRDHLDHAWTHEVVSYPLTPDQLGSDWQVRDEQDRPVPTQLHDGRVHFLVDQLPALGERTFHLAKRESQPDLPFSLTPIDHGCIVSNPQVRLIVPDSVSASDMPTPTLHLSLEHSVLGGAHQFAQQVELSPDLAFEKLQSNVLTQGELWLDWRLRIVCTNGTDYSVDLRLWHDAEYVEIREASTLCRESYINFEFDRCAPPNQPPTYPRMLTHRHNQVIDVVEFAAKRAGDLGSIQMPLQSGMWVPDDYYHVAFVDPSNKQPTALFFAGIENRRWDYPYENQLSFQHHDDRTRLRLSIKAGHRAWIMGLTDGAALQAADPWHSNAIYRIIKRIETPLDVVKDYVLAWQDVPHEQRPVAAATADQLARAQRNGREEKQFRDYRARCNPELAGDFTYYHAGTHRPFKDDHWNDPAALYVSAEDPAERLKQAAFMRDVVLTGLKNRTDSMLKRGGHIDDNTGSINMGRGLRPWAALYDLCAREGVFSEAQDQWVRAVFAFWCYKIADPDFWPAQAILLRDDHPKSMHRTYWYPGRQSDWNMYNIDTIPHNFHGDLWSAHGCVAMVLPQHPESRAWLDQTLEYWECELTQWVFPEGAWLESSTYTLNSMKDYLIYCNMLFNSGIRDYFSDERLQRAFRCIAEHLGPQDERIGGNTLPVMGDGSYPNVFCYVTGWMAGLAKQTAPEFAALMAQTWRGTGAYLVEPGRFGLNFLDFLYQDPTIEPTPMPTQHSKWYQGLGAILRHAWGTPEEVYCFIKAGKIYSHFHEPEGTFQLWWNSLPLCDEYGVQYGKGHDGTPLWDPSCHNCIEVPGNDLCYNKGDIDAWVSTPTFDYVRVEAPIHKAYLREGEGQWGFKGETAPAAWMTRHFFFVKPHYLYIVDVLDCPLPSIYHLNVKATAVERVGDTVHFAGRYGTDLTVLLADRGEREPRFDEMDTAPTNVTFVPPEGFYHQHRMHVDGAPYEGFESLLVPHPSGTTVATSREPATGALRIERDGGVERAMLYTERRVVGTPDLVFSGRVGAVHQSATGLTLYQAVGNRIGVPGLLEIHGDGPFTATLDGACKLALTTSGIARWLTISGHKIATVTCDGHSVACQAVDGGSRFYVPAGAHSWSFT